MPTYEYVAKDGEPGCSRCQAGFERVQSIRDNALETCPDCQSAVRRVIFAPGISKPVSDSKLKELGFKKLVRRDSGVYEEVTNDNKSERIIDTHTWKDKS